MLCWLASYPRSGNTFARIVLKRMLGLNSHSLHEGDNIDFGKATEVSATVGHQAVATSRFLTKARSDGAVRIVKTHEPPSSNDKAIYIVRDGRSALISFYHYIRSKGHYSSGIEDVIDGGILFGDWSSHFRAWDPVNRPDTLLVRFEALIARPEEFARSASEFLGVPIKDETPPNFGTLHEMKPAFFRSGSDDANKAELGLHSGRFFARHGELMCALGYADLAEVMAGVESYVRTLEQAVGSSRSAEFERLLYTIEGNSHDRYLNLWQRLDRIDESFALLTQERGQRTPTRARRSG